MYREKIAYSSGEEELVGQLFCSEPSTVKRPAVLVAHAWRGQDDFARHKAEELAQLGYVGFAMDLYGKGKEVHSDEEAVALMTPLFQDRVLLQKRVRAAYEAIRQHPAIDISKIGGIGFCFGGLAIIELLRSGVEIRGVASFHAVLGNQMGDIKAKTVPIAKQIKGALLMLHGHDDPLVTNEDILRIQNELTEAQVDWQMNIYGHTSHAFTNPDAHDEKKGLIFNKKASDRAWLAMQNFFHEVFR